MFDWLTERPDYWRGVLLAALVVTLLAPWGFTSDGLPPPEYCEPPNLIRNERCVRQVLGWEIVSIMFQALLTFPLALIRGEWSGRGREFFGILLFLSPVLPFITTLLLYLRESTGRRMAHIMGWVLVNGLWLFLLVTLRSLEFWGVGLLLVTAVSALLLEGAALLRLRRPGKGAA